MNNRRRSKRATERRTSGQRVFCDQSQDDELQSDQRAGRRSDNHVEVLPFGERCHGLQLTGANKGNKVFVNFVIFC